LAAKIPAGKDPGNLQVHPCSALSQIRGTNNGEKGKRGPIGLKEFSGSEFGRVVAIVTKGKVSEEWGRNNASLRAQSPQ
jgi:hypothetical protein